MDPLAYGGVVDAGTSTKNKTFSWRTGKIPFWKARKCTNCLLCFHFCPENAIKVNKDNKISGIDFDFCKGCGVCARECPFEAIEMKKEE